MERTTELEISTIARDDLVSEPFKGVVTAERRKSDDAVVVRAFRTDPAVASSPA